MAEDFSEHDPGELLAECICDFLYEDLDRKVATDIENYADDILCVNLVDKHNDYTCDVYDGVCIDTHNADSQCAVFSSTMHSFDKPIPRVRL
jgi:hypothetical protein